MAQHSFAKTGSPTVLFSVAPAYPYGRTTQPRARVGRNDAGTVQVATLGSPDQFYQLRFLDLPEADVLALDAFFEAIKHQAETFTWTDHATVQRTARLWDSQIQVSQHAPDSFDVELNLLVAGS